MHFVVAPDSFKGSLSAYETAQCMERGIKAIIPDAVVTKVPVADGGEGMVSAVINASGGRLSEAVVTGPLGEPVKAEYGIMDDGVTGIVEVASACGLTLVPPDHRNPELTTSCGAGELIRLLIDCGCRKVIVGLGGSATNDGGMGMAAALGVRFLDAAGSAVEPVIGNIKKVCSIDFGGFDPRVAGIEVVGACDVASPLCGSGGASAVFGPQKGATPEQVARLDGLLCRLAELIHSASGRDLAGLPGAGAAGGLGYGLMAFLGGRLMSGSELVLELGGLDKIMSGGGIDLVITGEGELNGQTVLGKAPVGVARLAKKYGLPVLAVAGSIGPGYNEVYLHGIDAVYSIIPRPMMLAEAMRDAASILEEAVKRMIRLWLLSSKKGCVEIEALSGNS